MRDAGTVTIEEPLEGPLYPRFVREFLYVDIARLRSYLAQLASGLPDRVAEGIEEGTLTDTGLKVSGVGFERTGSRSTRSEETRT